MAIGHHYLGQGYAAGIDPWEAAPCLEGKNDRENDEWWAKIDYEAIYEEFVRAMVNAGLTRYCRVMRERSDTAIRLFADETVDVLHQDGNHSEEVSCAEVALWTPKLRRGGYWVSDDTDWATTQRAQTLILDSGFDLIEDHGNWRVYRKQ
jgi:hypothetical protein